MQEEERPAVAAARDCSEVLRIEAAGIRTHCEDMILVQATRNLVPPRSTAAKLVEIAALSHEDIAASEPVSVDVTSPDYNLLDLSKIQASVFHIRYPQVRPCRGGGIGPAPFR